MGCAPSRPSRSFYQEYFVEKAPAKTQAKKIEGKRSTVGKIAKQPKQQGVPLKETNHMLKFTMHQKKPGQARTLTREEEIARADLRIYAEEMKAKRDEEANRIFIMNCVLDGKGGSIF
ncbi:hypothetical protein N7G274_000604 [Stereocaulon virgatum]|uniref:Uncharacterized protein n=1 Tax=Stereocaulon virgatum TaxID=373712 RepID=A0ABR4AUY1_9LECA